MPSRIVATSGLPEGALDEHRQFGRPDLYIELQSPARNVTLGLDGFERQIGGCLEGLARDLVELAAVVLMADLGCQRGRNERWPRDLELLVPVREPDVWAQQRPHIEAMLAFLTGDNVRLTFAPLEPVPDEPGRVDTQAPPPFDCVSLLSGGLDSLAGALLLIQSGRRPLFVMHRDLNRRVAAAQRHVISLVTDRAATRVAGISLHPSAVLRPRHTFPEDAVRERSQRSRSFFFLASAVAAAQALGIHEVFLFENGIIARNIPLSAARIGSISTRTAHPRFVEEFARLAADLFGGRWTISNPFLSKTKGEIVAEILAPELHPKEIRGTVSCWQAGRAPRPCGGCVPCLLRRIAFAKAGIGDEVCLVDILADPMAHRDTDAFGNMSDLLTTAARLRETPTQELVVAFPALVEDTAGVQDAVNLLRRFGEEIEDVLTRCFPAAWQLAGRSGRNL